MIKTIVADVLETFHFVAKLSFSAFLVSKFAVFLYERWKNWKHKVKVKLSLVRNPWKQNVKNKIYLFWILQQWGLCKDMSRLFVEKIYSEPVSLASVQMYVKGIMPDYHKNNFIRYSEKFFKQDNCWAFVGNSSFNYISVCLSCKKIRRSDFLDRGQFPKCKCVTINKFPLFK